MEGGTTSSTSASRDDALTVASISDTSVARGPMCREANESEESTVMMKVRRKTGAGTEGCGDVGRTRATGGAAAGTPGREFAAHACVPGAAPPRRACFSERGPLAGERTILRVVEQRVSFRRAGQPDGNHPGAVRIAVHLLGRILERGIDLDDLSRHRGEELGDGLDRLDRPECLPQ